MDIAEVMPFVEQRHQGVLGTHRKNGRPQLSNIAYGVVDGRIGISLTTDRAKTANMRRDARASLHVTSDDFWSWVVLDCDVELGPVAQQPGDRANQELIALYRAVRGEHPDWDDFEAAMVRDRRLVASLTPTHAYGQLPG